mmetsp:Transcript_113220/g.316344  ORF Transcript_113220/g.316344 Transcript_113220/m.316344 type:complete len:218 (-) Transcript_113220:356-1009(-)
MRRLGVHGIGAVGGGPAHEPRELGGEMSRLRDGPVGGALRVRPVAQRGRGVAPASEGLEPPAVAGAPRERRLARDERGAGLGLGAGICAGAPRGALDTGGGGAGVPGRALAPRARAHDRGAGHAGEVLAAGRRRRLAPQASGRHGRRYAVPVHGRQGLGELAAHRRQQIAVAAPHPDRQLHGPRARHERASHRRRRRVEALVPALRAWREAQGGVDS